MIVSSEIVKGAKILFVGRDPGDQEVRQGRPFVGPSGDLLNRCLGLAGLQRGKDVSITNLVSEQPAGNVFARHSKRVVEEGIRELHRTIERECPDVVVCLGNEAAYALIPDWPAKGGSVYGAYGIQERRGYWSTVEIGGREVAVVATLHPSGILRSGGRGAGAIDEMLLTYDLERAKEVAEKGLQRPLREVKVVATHEEAVEAAAVIRSVGWVACDIENTADERLACVGFAPFSRLAYVFTPRVFEEAFDLLRDPKVGKCFHNGQYDMYFLRTRCGVDVKGFVDDTIVAFHCCWPALAGKSVRGTGRTQKRLLFLASLYTFDEFWKDYDFATDHERYALNGQDCMVTFDVHHRLVQERRALGISEEIYQHELSLVWPCILILERGIRINKEKLGANREALLTTVTTLAQEIEATVRPLLEAARERISRPGLFWTRTACKCCHNGKGKKGECWACAGFPKKPSKKALGETVLKPCAVCAGEGSSESFAFNFDSADQKKALLYEVLGITTRYKDGRPCSDEDKLKEILGSL